MCDRVFDRLSYIVLSGLRTDEPNGVRKHVVQGRRMVLRAVGCAMCGTCGERDVWGVVCGVQLAQVVHKFLGTQGYPGVSWVRLEHV